MPLSTEEMIHGGYLHLSRQDLSRRMAAATPSLYDCLLASIYFRKAGDPIQALRVLDGQADSPVFEATYNRLQAMGHRLDFQDSQRIAEQALRTLADNWTPAQRDYATNIARTSAVLADLAAYPTALDPDQLQCNGYWNLDSQEFTACTGLVDGSRRLARPVDALFDPGSQCWLDRGRGTVIGELLQPEHHLCSFFGGMTPWQIAADAAGAAPEEQLDGVAVFVESNPHYGHFLTQSGSYANALQYAEQLLPAEAEDITVLSRDAIPPWGQEMLQASCRVPLTFAVIDRQRRLQARRLVVAPPTWIEWHYVHRDHPRPFRRAAETLLQRSTGEAGGHGGLRLYFSRSQLGDCLRRSINEEALETELAQRGFTIVHPQELPLAEVVRLVNEAALIAGASGSAMHNVLFRLPGPPLMTLNFAHALPATNGALVERGCGLNHNLYLRCTEEEERPPGEANGLRFNVERCLEGAAMALDQLSKLA